MKKKLLIISAAVLLVILLFFLFGCHKRLYAQAVIRAIESNDNTRLEHLLSMGGDINATPHYRLTALWFERFNYPPLLLACERGNADAVKILLRHGADPNIIRDDRTALIIACSSYATSRNEVILLLLEEDIDVSFTDSYGNTALDYYEITCDVSNYCDEQTELILQKLKNLQDRGTAANPVAT